MQAEGVTSSNSMAVKEGCSACVDSIYCVGQPEGVARLRYGIFAVTK
jgi:hypothetical protein